jgi:hypothetical protein
VAAVAPVSAAVSAAAVPTAALPTKAGPLAFPSAQGFGAQATGGRGGAVCVVGSLGKTGPGTLHACLQQKGPRTVVFRVGGTIEGPLEIPSGDLTIAGQTAPGGITIRGGLVCDNVYDKNNCANLIVRHVRFRQGAPDGVRLGGTHDVILDHVSLSGAEDENLEITRSERVTVQYSVIAEPRGDHYKWGGVLLNYSKDVMPLGDVSLHHNVWNGVAGRLPEISCEENGDGPGKSNCAGRTLRVDLVNNVLWDVQDPIWVNRCTGNNEGNDCAVSPKNVLLDMNLVGNVLVRRTGADADAPFIEPHVWEGANRIVALDNVLGLGASRSKVERRVGAAPHPHGLEVTPALALPELLGKRAGAFPRDAKDTRLAAYLARPVDQRPPSFRDGKGIDIGDDAPPAATDVAPADADGDGMPDAWERAHGTDAQRADGASLDLGARANNGVPGCTRGYTALECYLNELADARVR